MTADFVFRPRRQRRRVGLNLTSLIDVLFLLLIFFMLTSTFRRNGEMQLELPSSTTSNLITDADERKFIDVVMDVDGSLRIDGQPTSAEDAPGVLRQAHQADPQRSVRLKAAADARHADVVRLYDLVREVGFPGFSLGTEILAPRSGDSRRKPSEGKQ